VTAIIVPVFLNRFALSFTFTTTGIIHPATGLGIALVIIPVKTGSLTVVLTAAGTKIALRTNGSVITDIIVPVGTHPCT